MAQRSGAGRKRTSFASDSASRKLESGTRKSASDATVSDISCHHRIFGATPFMDISFIARRGIGPGALVVGILDGGGLTAAAAAADEATGGAVKRALAVSRFKGQPGHSLELLAPAGVEASRIVLAGLGKIEAFNAAAAEGIFLARDLVNEPANILYPDEFAKRTQALKKLGVRIEVLDVPAMQKLGMNALLGVGQGSAHESRVAVMQWNGARKGSAKKSEDGPLAFIG